MLSTALRFLLRMGIFLFAALWNLTVGIAASLFIGLYVGLRVTGQSISLNSSTMPVWPEGLRSIEIYYWGRAWYLAVGLALLFLILPLSLALLERFFLALRSNPDHEAETPGPA